MTKATRDRYTLAFKQEAVRLAKSGQTMAAVSRSLGVVAQTLYNWVKAHRAGTFKGASGKPQVSAGQMARFQRRPDRMAARIFHSDRGSQYASGGYSIA